MSTRVTRRVSEDEAEFSLFGVRSSLTRRVTMKNVAATYVAKQMDLTWRYYKRSFLCETCTVLQTEFGLHVDFVSLDAGLAVRIDVHQTTFDNGRNH